MRGTAYHFDEDSWRFAEFDEAALPRQPPKRIAKMFPGQARLTWTVNVNSLWLGVKMA
ncbi:MAG: hypothetical protein WA789_09625 [Candidatus Acidiferrum sp.]